MDNDIDMHRWMLKSLIDEYKFNPPKTKADRFTGDIREIILDELTSSRDEETSNVNFERFINVKNIDSAIGAKNKLQLFKLINEDYVISKKYILLDRRYSDRSLSNENKYQWVFTSVIDESTTNAISIGSTLSNIISIRMLPFSIPKPDSFTSDANFIFVTINEIKELGYSTTGTKNRFHFIFRSSVIDSTVHRLSNPDIDDNIFQFNVPLYDLTSITITLTDGAGNDLYNTNDLYKPSDFSIGGSTVITLDRTPPAVGEYIVIENYTTTSYIADASIISNYNAVAGHEITARDEVNNTITIAYAPSPTGSVVYLNDKFIVYIKDSMFRIPIEISYIDNNI